MDIKKIKRKADRLFFLWILLFGSYDIALGIYVAYQRTIQGNNPIAMLSKCQLLSLGMVALVFLPLLFRVHHYAVLSQATKLRNVVRFILCLLCVWTAIMLILTICAAIGFL